MKKVRYTDKDGRHTLVWLPDTAPDADARMGVPIGPPPLGALKLPKAIDVRLHNELFARGLFTREDVTRNRRDVISALMAALKVDAEAIIGCYSILDGGEETV